MADLIPSAHQFSELNIWAKLHENPSKIVADNTSYLTLKFDLNLDAKKLLIFKTKFHDNPSHNEGKMVRTQNRNTYIQPSSVTLTSGQNGWLRAFAHHFSELNIWTTFHKNLSKNGGHMTRTQNAGSNILNKVGIEGLSNQEVGKSRGGVKKVGKVGLLESL